MCNGVGEIITNPCLTCKGQGRVKSKEKIKVDIPPGVTSGIRVKVGGHGDAGIRGAPMGDLYVIVNVKDHVKFVRNQDDIIFYQNLSFTQAALGAELKVPTLNGKHKLVVPPGTQTGAEFRLKNKGIPHLNQHGQGDHFIVVNIETPTKLSNKEKKLLIELAKQRGEDISTLSPKVLKKLKDIISS